MDGYRSCLLRDIPAGVNRYFHYHQDDLLCEEIAWNSKAGGSDNDRNLLPFLGLLSPYFRME